MLITSSTGMPAWVNISANSCGLRDISTGTNSFIQVKLAFISRNLLELFQETGIIFEEEAQVPNPVEKHSNPFNP